MDPGNILIYEGIYRGNSVVFPKPGYTIIDERYDCMYEYKSAQGAINCIRRLTGGDPDEGEGPAPVEWVTHTEALQRRQLEVLQARHGQQ